MSVRLDTGTFTAQADFAIEDFETLSVGTITSLPEVIGTGSCRLHVGTFNVR